MASRASELDGAATPQDSGHCLNLAVQRGEKTVKTDSPP